MTVQAPCILMLGLEISLQNRKSADKEDRPEFYALFLFLYLLTVASGTIEGKQVRQMSILDVPRLTGCLSSVLVGLCGTHRHGLSTVARQTSQLRLPLPSLSPPLGSSRCA